MSVSLKPVPTRKRSLLGASSSIPRPVQRHGTPRHDNQIALPLRPARRGGEESARPGGRRDSIHEPHRRNAQFVPGNRLNHHLDPLFTNPPRRQRRPNPHDFQIFHDPLSEADKEAEEEQALRQRVAARTNARLAAGSRGTDVEALLAPPPAGLSPLHTNRRDRPSRPAVLAALLAPEGEEGNEPAREEIPAHLTADVPAWRRRSTEENEAPRERRRSRSPSSSDDETAAAPPRHAREGGEVPRPRHWR